MNHENTKARNKGRSLPIPVTPVVSRLCAGCALLALAAAGCGSEQPQPTFPVDGVVQWSDGRPATDLAEATVMLSGIDGDGPTIPVNPRGLVQPDGTFVLGTYEPGDGAPTGKYRVSVTSSAGPRGGFGSRATAGKTTKPLQVIDPRFMSYRTSGLEVTIKSQNNQLQLTVERAKH